MPYDMRSHLWPDSGERFFPEFGTTVYSIVELNIVPLNG